MTDGYHRLPLAEERDLLDRALVALRGAGPRSDVRALVAYLEPKVRLRVSDARRAFKAGPTGQEDLEQVAWEALFAQDARALRGWDPAKGSLHGYVGQVARHRAISALRKRTEPVGYAPVEELPRAPLDRDARCMLVRLVLVLFERLSPVAFEVFICTELLELTPKEAAARHRLSIQSVYGHIKRNKRASREVFALLGTGAEIATSGAARRSEAVGRALFALARQLGIADSTTEHQDEHRDAQILSVGTKGRAEDGNMSRRKTP